MVAYLLLLQGAALVYLVSGAERERIMVSVMVVQLVLIGTFWLAFGGYSIDAWRYWWRFGQSPFSLDTDRLFWIAGWLLQKVFEYPWSLRLVSAIGILVLAWAIWRYFRDEDRELIVLAYMAMPLVPVFFLGFGNAVRQAIAAALCLLGMSLFTARKRRPASLVWIAAMLVHLPVIVLLVAALAARYAGRFAPWALLLLPLAGLGLDWMIAHHGFNLELIVPYSDDAEGRFHYLKYLVHLAVVLLSLVVLRSGNDRRHAWLIDTYCYAVAFASTFLLYEVPFERLLLYAEIFLPILAALLFRRLIPGRVSALAWGILALAGTGLWMHPSIRNTLGL